MIPAEFDYTAPETLDDAIKALADGGEEAKLLAGGHSLLPLMKLRLAAPSLLVDLRKVPGLHGIQRENGNWRIGALTCHSDLEHTPDLGVVSVVAGTIADPQVRNRGTIGGSLAHGDPAADLPAVMLICEASVTLQGAGGAQRTVAASDLFKDYLETAVEPNEVLTEIRMPAYDGWGHSYQKFNRRSEDWAMVAVSALVHRSGDTIEDVRVGLTNMASVPLRAGAVEEALRGQPATAENIASAAEHAAEGTDPPADLNASSDYKRHLARVLTRRALAEAAGVG
jgi:aerobic carbon-monoxide dehydrogenase medium subunit